MGVSGVVCEGQLYAFMVRPFKSSWKDQRPPFPWPQNGTRGVEMMHTAEEMRSGQREGGGRGELTEVGDHLPVLGMSSPDFSWCAGNSKV